MKRREQQAILDTDLAKVYGVETRALNQAVKRNPDRFPSLFLIELNREEILSISQTVTPVRTAAIQAVLCCCRSSQFWRQ